MKKTHLTNPRKTRSPSVDPLPILVRDVMKTDVLVLRADDSIRFAAEQLEEIRASGAPVVDEAGQLIGVLTLSDIARSEHVEEKSVTTRLATEGAPDLEATIEAEGVDEEVFPTDEYVDEVVGRVRVADWMTPGVTQVAPETTLADMCRVMLDADVHRVFVVERERLLGVVSTKDVVRLLAAPASKARAWERR